MILWKMVFGFVTKLGRSKKTAVKCSVHVILKSSADAYDAWERLSDGCASGPGGRGADLEILGQTSSNVGDIASLGADRFASFLTAVVRAHLLPF